MAIAQRASTGKVGVTNYVQENTYRPPPPPEFLRKMVALRLSFEVSAIRSLIALPIVRIAPSLQQITCISACTVRGEWGGHTVAVWHVCSNVRRWYCEYFRGTHQSGASFLQWCGDGLAIAAVNLSLS